MANLIGHKRNRVGACDCRSCRKAWSLRRRLIYWFELQIGAGGDLHRQVWYAWRDYPDAMRLTIGLFFLLGSLTTCATAWLIVKFVF